MVNNKDDNVFLSPNYSIGMIVAPWKFHVNQHISFSLNPKSLASQANINNNNFPVPRSALNPRQKRSIV